MPWSSMQACGISSISNAASLSHLYQEIRLCDVNFTLCSATKRSMAAPIDRTLSHAFVRRDASNL